MTVKPFRLLYADGELAVAVKSAGILSQKEYGVEEDMVSLLAGHFRDAGEPAEIYPVHRLDRGVGGVMVYARTRRSAAALSAAFSDHESTEKEYLAVVRGTLPSESALLEDYLLHDERRRRTTVVEAGNPKGKLARLSLRVLDRAAAADGKEYSLLSVRLYTGRTHQIRAQLSSRGYPLAGDGRYGAHDRFPTIALFSARLSFLHPLSSERMTFEAKPIATLPFTLFQSLFPKGVSLE